MGKRNDEVQPGPSSFNLPTIVKRKIIENYVDEGIGGDRKSAENCSIIGLTLSSVGPPVQNHL